MTQRTHFHTIRRWTRRLATPVLSLTLAGAAVALLSAGDGAANPSEFTSATQVTTQALATTVADWPW